MPALKAKQLKAEQLKAAVDPENTDEAQRRADEAQRRHDAEREAWLKKREAERRERLDAEADSVASELIALNRDTARRIHDLLWRDSNERLMRALARALGLDDDGNGVDAEASAEAMKAKHAAAEFVEEFVLDLKDEAAS